MIDNPAYPPQPRRPRNTWLILIAAFKLAQALLFAAIGVGALRLVGKDVGDELTWLAEHLRVNQESRFFNFVLERASLLSDSLLRRLCGGFFTYAVLDLIEGTGLYLEKVWAEYLTLAITASFLPLEIFEIFRRITTIRVSLLVVNVLVFLYLLQLVVKHRHRIDTNSTP